MPNKIRRPLTLRDLVILVANTALALGAARYAWTAASELYANTPFQGAGTVYAISAFVAVQSVGLVPLFLVNPRPRLRQLVRQPGAVVALTVAFTFAMIGLVESLVAIARCIFPSPLGVNRFQAVWILSLSSPTLVGPCVTTSWALLLLIAGWRPQPNWLDRLGRVFGVSWMVLTVAFSIFWGMSF
jgi:hypothetical protein